MRSALSIVPLLLAGSLAAQGPPACATTALAAAPDAWDGDNVVAGDLTLDGHPDVAFWKNDGTAVMLFIAACDGAQAVETWRFRIELPDAGTPVTLPVQVVNPLLDQALVDRVCASGRADECEHMRGENRRRQATADAGGRELRVGAPESAGIRLRWSREHRGFMRIGG